MDYPCYTNINIGKHRTKQLEAIAQKHLIIDDLLTRGRDHLDFHEVSTAMLLDALNEAFELGKKDERQSIENVNLY